MFLWEFRYVFRYSPDDKTFTLKFSWSRAACKEPICSTNSLCGGTKPKISMFTLLGSEHAD